MNITEINVALARAMGVSTENLSEVTLTLAPGRLPLVRATYLARELDEITRVVKELRLGVVGVVPPDQVTVDRQLDSDGA